MGLCRIKAEKMNPTMLHKINRELARIRRHIYGFPSFLFDNLFSTFYYDCFLRSDIIAINGDLPFQEKCAIFLIFPDPNLNMGHRDSLNYLNMEGYSPIVVSNALISDEELELLRPLTHKIIIRPNYGYDFGGYRDGILSLYFRRKELSHLALFNDSCWFPLHGSVSWLTVAEGMNVDFAGALAHAGMDWYDVLNDTKVSKKRMRKHLNLYHYCSFALLFSRGALLRKDFWNFWQNLRISSSKDRTIRYGERALSKFMFNKKFSHNVSIADSDIVYSLRTMRGEKMTSEVSTFIDRQGWPAYALREHLWSHFRFMFLKKKFNGEIIISQTEDLEVKLQKKRQPFIIL